jgi:hypothetical protein
MEGPKRSSQHLPEVAHPGARFSAQHPGEYNERPSNPPAHEYQRQSISPSHFIQSLNRTSGHATAPIEDRLEPGFARTDQPLPPSPKAPYLEIYSPGLQSALGVSHPEQPTIQTQQPEERRRKRICGINIPWFLFLVALIVCAVIAVATACGVVFGTKKK